MSQVNYREKEAHFHLQVIYFYDIVHCHGYLRKCSLWGSECQRC